MTDQAKRTQSKPGPIDAEPPPLLDRDIQGRIGDHLRAMYDGMVQQPVPDRFHELIAKLEGGASAKGGSRT